MQRQPRESVKDTNSWTAPPPPLATYVALIRHLSRGLNYKFMFLSKQIDKAEDRWCLFVSTFDHLAVDLALSSLLDRLQWLALASVDRSNHSIKHVMTKWSKQQLDNNLDCGCQGVWLRSEFRALLVETARIGGAKWVIRTWKSDLTWAVRSARRWSFIVFRCYLVDHQQQQQKWVWKRSIVRWGITWRDKPGHKQRVINNVT